MSTSLGDGDAPGLIRNSHHVMVIRNMLLSFPDWNITLPAFILTMGQSSLRVTERRQPGHAALVVFSPFLSDRRSTAFATGEMKDEWDETIGRVCPFIAHLRTSNVYGLRLTIICSCVRSAFP